MAHASSREKAVLQMKKMRKARAKRKLEENKKKQEMGEEEYEALARKRNEKTLKDRAQLALWDYKHHQYSLGKYAELKEILAARKKQIIDDEEKFSAKELRDIEVVLNELSKR